MTVPARAQTLLQIRDAVPPIPRLADCTVLLIDWQEEYRSGDLILQDVEATIGRAAEVLTRARVAGARIVHVAHAGTPGEMFDRTAPRGAFVADLAPLPGEVVVEKTAPSAFTHTNLAEVLDADGRRPLVVMGAMTHMCVSSTLRVAAGAPDAPGPHPRPGRPGGRAQCPVPRRAHRPPRNLGHPRAHRVEPAPPDHRPHRV